MLDETGIDDSPVQEHEIQEVMGSDYDVVSHNREDNNEHDAEYFTLE